MGFLTEPFCSHRQTVFQKCHINTDIIIFYSFPSNQWVTNRTYRCTNLTITTKYIIGSSNSRLISRIVNILITHTSPSCMNLQVIKDMLFFHEWLFWNTPCRRYCRKSSVLIIFHEFRRTIYTDRSSQIVTVVVIIHHTSQIRDQWRIGIHACRLRILRTGWNIVQVLFIGRSTFFWPFQPIFLETFHRITSHHIQIVFMIKTLNPVYCICPVPVHPIIGFTICFAIIGFL